MTGDFITLLRTAHNWKCINYLFLEFSNIFRPWLTTLTETLESEPMDKGDRGAAVLLGHVVYEKTKIYSPLKYTSLCETGQIKWYIQIPKTAKFPWVNWNLFFQPCAMILYTWDIPQSRLCTKYILQMYLFQEVEHVWHNYLYLRSRKNE